VKLFIDPGHGGNDSGAIGPTGLQEKDWNLHVAHLLAMGCEWAGIQVMWSRNGDYNVSELASALSANDWDADYYVAIHANSFGPHSHGCEVLYADDELGSNRWAANLQDELLSRFPQLRNRGTKERNDLSVLTRTNMPAVLIEPAFLSNPEEEAFLRRFSTKALVADAIISSLGLTSDAA